MKNRRINELLVLCWLLFSFNSAAQAQEISSERQNVLRGSITEQRAWWDLQHYQLSVAVDIGEKRFSGSNLITYKVLSDVRELQLELQQPMVLVAAYQQDTKLAIRQEGYSYFITTVAANEVGKEYQLRVEFNGQPHAAKNAPWDGGVTWSEDGGGMPFIATSNQGIGASIWWPNKDHGYDEPDRGIDMFIEVPQPFVNVSNGRLVNVEDKQDVGSRIFHWQVKSPINNYGVNINIADYVNFSEVYQGETGPLDMDYYVLRENEDKARMQFKDVLRTMQALEHWFGPYPFYQDSFKLVEVPYLGMEHQSSVTYGNGYQNGYKGRDLSGTDWGLKWDYIIIHEMAHEWFANSITAKDIADLWVQEGFTTYAEGLFVEYHYGKQAGDEYQQGLRQNINNDKPVIGPYHQHKIGSFDMYPKGAALLHTIRQVINDDDKWREILRGLGTTFYHQTVSTAQIEQYIIDQSGKALGSLFDQYLRDNRLPILEFRIKGQQLTARWSNVIEGFEMPIRASIGEQEQWFNLTTQWQPFELHEGELVWDNNFYIAQAFLALQ
ncbi:M1 family metallopeptidase [Thalassotalea sp. M1531]|uniref:M1 family metallopeptidase n=1 Tax=Thalassotalea algicola TaxID=2716224 RepID=A0A7Y0L9V4_9GAMM|nr:M1 family metallopeptidase [Thalassotalea algicola]NMP30639.1 M1 family metallopeptidase [Thalassotalea algicola]